MVYFLIDTYIDSEKGRGSYDEYIERVIIIRFPDREHMERCFESEEYKEIMGMRISSVDARAIIVEED